MSPGNTLNSLCSLQLGDSVAFDFDGTLVNCKTRQCEVLQSILRQKGINLIDFNIEKWWKYKTNGLSTFDALIKMHLKPETAKYINTNWIKIVENPEWLDLDTLFDSVIPILKRLKELDKKIYVITARKSEYFFLNQIKKLGIEQYIRKCFVVEPIDSIEQKKEILSRLKPTLFIGDTENDYYSAQKSGVKFIAISKGQRSKQFLINLGIPYIIPDFYGLDKIVLQMNKINSYMIHPTSDVQTTKIGENTFIWQFCVVLPGAIIGSNCNINYNVFIENDVILGNNVTIKSGVQLWDGITLEDDVFVGPNVAFTNDAYPRSKKNQFNFDITIVKKGASIGANATILSGISIGRYSMIGAAAVVTKNIHDFELWVGNPARHVGFVSESGEALDMNLKSKRTGKQYQWIENMLAEKPEYIIKAEGISMRLIEETDAKFIIDLRTDEKLGQYISETSASIENQIDWIKQYKRRERNQKEYYFIIEDSNNKKWGTIRLYNIEEDCFTIGSWICLQGNKNHIAIKSFLLTVKFGFEKLHDSVCLLDVRKKNIGVLYFLKLFNLVLVKEDDLNYFFRLEKNNFYNNINKITNTLNIKLQD